MNAEVTTRRATEADLEQVAALFDAYRQFYEQPADLDLAREYIGARMRNGESILFVAAGGDGTLAGFCQLYPTFCSVDAAPILVLYDLFVDPAWRRHGVGRALMQTAARYGAEQGVAHMDLSTGRTNKAGQALYESLGWQRDDVFLYYTLPLDGARQAG
jgi:ribosomal protein S18 acetylase RimI-like enzyme